jgi:hypothetical protein
VRRAGDLRIDVALGSARKTYFNSLLEQRIEDELVSAAIECIGNAAPLGEILKLTIEARNRGLRNAARAILERLIEYKSTLSGAYSQLAFLYRQDGDHARAASLLYLAVENAPGNVQLRRDLAHMLFAASYWTEAESILRPTPAANDTDRRALVAIRQFGAYVRRYPVSAALQMLSEVKARHVWLDHVACSEMLRKSIRTGSPLSLIRLGDGEGAMLRLGEDDENEFAMLYDTNRQNRISSWFGNEFQWRTNGFFELSKDLVPAINGSTIIGMPDRARLISAYKIASPLVIPSLLNILRSCLEPGRSGIRVSLLCTSAIHRDLHFGGHLERFIREARRVSVISCHAGLGDALKSAFDLLDATVYLIPGEHRSASVLDESAFVEAHYPVVFDRLQKQLATPQLGRVFVIAGASSANSMRELSGKTAVSLWISDPKLMLGWVIGPGLIMTSDCYA